MFSRDQQEGSALMSQSAGNEKRNLHGQSVFILQNDAGSRSWSSWPPRYENQKDAWQWSMGVFEVLHVRVRGCSTQMRQQIFPFCSCLSRKRNVQLTELKERRVSWIGRAFGSQSYSLCIACCSKVVCFRLVCFCCTKKKGCFICTVKMQVHPVAEQNCPNATLESRHDVLCVHDLPLTFPHHPRSVSHRTDISSETKLCFLLW